MHTVILIPALNPTLKLVSLIQEVLDRLSAERNDRESRIIIVNDGSDKGCSRIFGALEDMGCEVLCHERNMGKGAALKTGFRHVLEHYSDAAGVVTADADGQHSPRDILRLAQVLENGTDGLVLGVRDFDGENVPLKSRIGNKITSLVFHMQTGRRLNDTQTGLRAVPMSCLDILCQAGGDRFEYEMNMLLLAHSRGIPFITVPIETIYRESNSSTHFRPFKDSALIYRDIVKFSLSSGLCAAVDFGLFTLLTAFALGGDYAGITFATVLARIFSGTLNFILNKYVVFEARNKGSHLKYITLFLVQMLLSSQLTALFANTWLSVSAAKLIVDISLFGMSFFIQRKIIFKKEGAHESHSV